MSISKILQNKRVHLAIHSIISLLLIGIILYFAGVDAVLKEFANINFFYLFLAVFFLFLMYLGMVLRIKIMLDEMGCPLSFMKILSAHFTGMLMSDFTPARSGYLATAVVLNKNYKIPSEKAMLSVIGPQAFDFVVKIGAGTVAVIYLIFSLFQGNGGYFLFIGVFGLLFVLLVMILLMFSRKFLSLFSFSKSIPFIGRIYNMFERMQVHSDIVIKKTPILILILIFTWTFKAISWWMVAWSAGLFIDFAYGGELVFYYFFQPLVTMLEFVPSPTLAGMGLSEGGGILVMSLFGISVAKITFFMLLARFKTIVLNLPGLYELQKGVKL
ncbi:flippase-like domain-containing protein [Candidatus Micrarchaeota archaeon]|nr:flippase-like domain-containing protein [Candidatus Micrarchaeota archaeon]